MSGQGSAQRLMLREAYRAEPITAESIAISPARTSPPSDPAKGIAIKKRNNRKRSRDVASVCGESTDAHLCQLNHCTENARVRALASLNGAISQARSTLTVPHSLSLLRRNTNHSHSEMVRMRPSHPTAAAAIAHR